MAKKAEKTESAPTHDVNSALAAFAWPEIKDLHGPFPTLKTQPVLLELANRKPYETGYDTFTKIFHRGGRIKFHHELSEWEKKAFVYVRAFMKSWEPKHEEKTKICSMIFEELGISLDA